MEGWLLIVCRSWSTVVHCVVPGTSRAPDKRLLGRGELPGFSGVRHMEVWTGLPQRTMTSLH